MAIGAGHCDCIGQAPFGGCSVLERLTDLTKGGRWFFAKSGEAGPRTDR